MTTTRRNKQSRKADKTNQGGKETKQTQMAQGAQDSKEKIKNRNNGRGPDKAAAAMGSTAETDGAGSPSQQK
eukprot:11227857-Ditylum_brightwellii.AAC.1